MFSEEKVNNIIREIGPLNNNYRLGIRTGLKGTEILKIMWDIGDVLFKENINQIHTAAWEIYGRTPGNRKSYITRDLLSYCFRIRKFFKNRSDINRQFPHLKKYSIFREALPFLDNKKYKLSENEKDELLKVMNSNLPYVRIKRYIVNLKKNKISIKNPRTQRLQELEYQKIIFMEVYNSIKDLVDNKNEVEIKKMFGSISIDTIRKVVRLLLYLAHEGFKKPESIEAIKDNEKLQEFLNEMFKISNSNLETRNRFRRLINPTMIIKMSEFFSCIKSKDDFKEIYSIRF
ncbi:MAG: hypothetical protein FJW69_09885 [Actinobacteria bacterium]|nr:hypothetical protein [Actinomycetota bacterium]